MVGDPIVCPVEIARSVALFVIAALAEIGGAYLVWQAVREGRPWWLALLGGAALFAYGFVAAFQPDANFGRVLAAYGGGVRRRIAGLGHRLRRLSPDRFDSSARPSASLA